MFLFRYSYEAKQFIEDIFNENIYTNDGHFTQVFLNWYSEFNRYVNKRTISQLNLPQKGVYNIGNIGKLIYRHYVIEDGNEIFLILGFHFSKLPYQQKKQQYYKVIGDGGYGYKIVQSTVNNKCAILTPQRKRLTKFAFDDIIGFHHSSNDFNIVHAIGFQGDRVFAIYTNGDIKVVHCSKSEYLNQKHRYDESHKPRTMVINESHIRTIIRETLRRLLQL